MSVRQVGVEDANAVSDRALRAARDNGAVVEQELEQDVRRGRRVAGEEVQAVGAAVVAVSTAVLELQRPALTPKDRYGRMMDRFGAVVTDLRCRTAESWAGT